MTYADVWQGLMEEARNKIMSLEDTTKQDAAQLSAANAKITEIDRQLQQAKSECNTKDETIEEMQASHLDEEVGMCCVCVTAS